MTLEEAARLSYYQEIAELNNQHGVLMVQHIESKRVFVKKILTTYDVGVFRYLQMNPIPHTPRVYEAVEDNNTLIVIEEYINGTSLDTLLDTRGTLTEQEVRYIASQVCSILSDFEKATPPLVHRDIKPSNIILSDYMEVTLLDMDAAKHQNDIEYQDTQLIGTFGYAAPEQYGFGPSDIRTDIYAVGVLMNVMLTGKFPNEKVAGGTLGSIIRRCTQMDAKDRYQTADELRQELMSKIKEEKKTEVRVEQVREKPGKKTGWTLPGFRGHNALVRIASGIGYFLLIIGCVNMPIEDRDAKGAAIYKIMSFVSIMSFVLVFCNYKGVWEFLGIDRIRSRFWRLCVAAIAATIAFYLGVAILLILEGGIG